MSWRRTAEHAVGVVSSVLLAVLLWTTFLDDPAPVSSAQQRDTAVVEPAAQLPERPEAALVITGRDDVGTRLGSALSAHVALHRGQGFAAGPGLFTVLPDELRGRTPRAVVLQAGEADVADPARAARALEQMVDRVRASRSGDVPVLVVGPLAADPDTATDELKQVRDALAASAAAKDVLFLDPLALDPTSGTDVIDQLGPSAAALLEPVVAAE